MPLSVAGAGSPSNTMWSQRRPTSIPSGILIHPAVYHNKHDPKIGESCHPPFSGGGGKLGPHLTQCRLGRGLLHTKWQSIQPFGHNGHGPKIGGCAPSGGPGSPSNTMWRGQGLPPCQVSSLSIQPFGNNTPTSQTDRTGQDRTDRQDNIGRTVLQTVAQ